jgi:MoxR-like ATPase
MPENAPLVPVTIDAERFAAQTSAILGSIGQVIDGKPDAVRSASVSVGAARGGISVALPRR